MIVTLDDSGWPAKQLRTIRGKVLTTLCSHNPIDHLLGRPCIQIHGFSRKDKEKARKISDLKHLYPLVHQRNILPILNHESMWKGDPASTSPSLAEQRMENIRLRNGRLQHFSCRSRSRSGGCLMHLWRK
jgi:hypothetical protein